MSKKLLLIGSNSGLVHLKNYYNLVSSFFDEVLVVSNSEVDFCASKEVDFSLKNPLKVRKNILRLRKIIVDFSPSIIHIHQANSFAYITSRANRNLAPQVLTTWGSDVLLLPQKGWMYKHIVTYSLKHSDYVTADASFMKAAINKMVTKEVLIANFGIDFQEEEIPEKLPIIYSNRLHNPLYRVDKIIQGFGEFLKNNPTWKLVIGANGSQTSELEKLANELLPERSFEFIGFVDAKENKRNYLQAHIWISNPESDGTAISLLEAMGYGCVPVVSDLPANNEWITSGENGIIIQESLSKSLEEALKLDQPKVQELNKSIIENKATKVVNKEKFLNLYKQIIND